MKTNKAKLEDAQRYIAELEKQVNNNADLVRKAKDLKAENEMLAKQLQACQLPDNQKWRIWPCKGLYPPVEQVNKATENIEDFIYPPFADKSGAIMSPEEFKRQYEQVFIPDSVARDSVRDSNGVELNSNLVMDAWNSRAPRQPKDGVSFYWRGGKYNFTGGAWRCLNASLETTLVPESNAKVSEGLVETQDMTGTNSDKQGCSGEGQVEKVAETANERVGKATFAEKDDDMTTFFNRASGEVVRIPVAKPPLGLIPKKQYDQQRKNDIMQAMRRYAKAGKAVPEEWVDELGMMIIGG